MSKVEIKTMAIEKGVNRVDNSRGGKGTIRRQEILASRHPEITTLPIRLVANVERITMGNAIKEPLFITNAVKRGTMQGDVLLKS